MEIRYIGPHDEVFIDVAPPVHCRRGETVDVDDTLGENLTAQDTWERVEPVRATSSKKEQ
jgi:hypothetical protein